MNKPYNAYLVSEWEKVNLLPGEKLESISGIRSLIQRARLCEIVAMVFLTLSVISISCLFVWRGISLTNIAWSVVSVVLVVGALMNASERTEERAKALRVKVEKFETYVASFSDLDGFFSSSLSGDGLKAKIRERLTSKATEIVIAEKALKYNSQYWGENDPRLEELRQSITSNRRLYDVIIREGARLGLCQTTDTRNHFDRATHRARHSV
jgi:hypothetical protein